MNLDPFRQLQLLSLLVMVLMIAPSAVPPLRARGQRLRLAALVLYLAGAAAILLNWQLAGR